jgi:hypothetical protein
MCVINPSCCRIHCTTLGLGYINTGRCHVIWFWYCSYTGISKYHKVSASLFDISRKFDVRYNPFLLPYPLHATRIRVYKHWTLSFHIVYCCSYTGISKYHKVSPSLFDISRQLDVRYKSLPVPYSQHVTRIIPYKHCTLSCHMILQSSIYRYK